MLERSRHWLAFIALCLIWGTSLFWQKLVLRELGPIEAVALRFLIATCVLAVILRRRRLTLPRDGRDWLEMFGLSLVYSVAPVLLASLAGTRIDSGLGSVLGASMPLFVILLAATVFREEQVTARKLAGTVLGFAGMLVIVGGDAFGAARSADLVGQLAQLGSSFCNALSSLLAQRMLVKRDPVVQAIMLMLLADLVIWPLVPLFGTFHLPTGALTWAALIWLGALASGVANLMYFDLLKAWGATRSGMIVYAIPIVGIAAGALLGETISPQLLAGATLVLGGIAIVNGLVPGRRRAPSRMSA